MQSLDWVHNLIKCGSSKNFEVYSYGIYSHREEPVFPDARKVKLSNKLSKQIHSGRLGLGGLCNLIGFYFSGKQHGVMVVKVGSAADFNLEVSTSPRPSPPQPSATQDTTTTLKLYTDLRNHFTSLGSRN